MPLGVFLRVVQDADEIHRYRLLVRSFCVMTGRQATLQQALNEHIAILDALASGRPNAARKAMAEHITSRLNEVLSRMTVPRITRTRSEPTAALRQYALWSRT